MTPNLKHTRRSFVSSVGALGAAILSPRKLFAAASASEAGSRADAKLSGFGASGTGLVMNSFMLQASEEKIMGERLAQFFRGHSEKT
jgi:hypothetical protein